MKYTVKSATAYITFITLLTSVILLMLVSSSNADYVNPPQWQGSYDFTHQSWDFNTDQAGTLPAIPDGDPNWLNTFATQGNDYNSPGLINIAYTGQFSWTCSWLDTYPDPSVPTYRTGFYGGMGNTFLTFYVPNASNEKHWKKQIWIQMTFHARKDGVKPYDIEVARDANFTDFTGIITKSIALDEPAEPEGVVGKWYRLTAVYEIPAGMQQEYIRLSAYQYPPDANHTMGGATVIDQVDIDSRYVNAADFDENGIVDMNDFSFFAQQWLKW